jgi:TonB family protein
VAYLFLVRRMLRFAVLFICLTALQAVALATTYDPPEVRAMFFYRPHPDYPFQLRARHFVGSGLFRLHVDERGSVTSVDVLRSTGHPELDSEALKAYRKWRAKPGTTREVDLPCTFALRHT